MTNSLITRAPPSVSTSPPRGGSPNWTRLCAEALTGIADPLFPALATARAVTPAEAARAILAALLAPLESPPQRGALPAWLLPHQADAVLRARAILARFGGVLVADAVGLGKTFIALALAAVERERGGDAVAIVPAALRDEWRRACAATGVPVTLLSHTELARRAATVNGRCSLLLVDEAHAFRNHRTRRYEAMARLAVGRRVALLTATPFNNGPADLVSLIRLFAARDRFREFGVADLPRALAHAAHREAAAPADSGAVSLALGALAVCRTRRIVEARFPELRGAFPARRLEPPTRYDLAAVYGGRLRELLAALDALRDAYRGHERGAALMHLGLLRRLESSRAALRRSLLRHRDFLAEISRAGNDGIALSRAAWRAAMPRGEDDDAQLVLWSLLAAPGAGAEPRTSLATALESVRAALDLIPSGCEGSDICAGTTDAKAAALAALLAGPLAGRRTIVFTEYRDTALLLLRLLRRHFRVLAVTGRSAWAGTTRLSRAEALDAFAPRARGRSPVPLLEATVLLATDVAGEGLNLQDGDTVVNYDLPWNPVRVMQRIGRIDRLGSPHREVRVVHLLPGRGGADLTGVLRRSRIKLQSAAAAPLAEPDPLASLWFVDGPPLTPEQIERESWRRVAPFEARERWRAAAGGARDAARLPVVAAALAGDGEPPRAGLLLALTWPDGRRIPLPYVAAPGEAPRRDAAALGELAERALAARPIPAEAAAFTSLVAAALPDARTALLELSAARHGTAAAGPGRRLALDIIQRQAAAAARSRGDARAAHRAAELLANELPAGLDRLIGRLAAAPGANGQLAVRLTEILETALPPAVPVLAGAPRISLVAAIVIATGCPADAKGVRPPP